VRDRGAKGLVTIPLRGEGSGSGAAKFFSAAHVGEMAGRFEANEGDLLLVVAGKAGEVEAALSALRFEIARRLGLIDPDLLVFCFIREYPLLEWSEEEGRWEPMHHPFTAPRDEDVPLLDTAPDRVQAKHYDLVCNGCELSSGSIRIHSRDMQARIFGLLGYSDDDVSRRFGHLLEAFEYGAPPHGGIAPGIDRFVMLLAGEETIREVIPFPKNQSAIDVMFDAPSLVSEEQLRELHLRLEDGNNKPLSSR